MRIVSLSLAGVLALGSAPAMAQQAQTGVLAGKATAEMKDPPASYRVQVRDAASGQIAGTSQLDPQGRFHAGNLPIARQYLVELYHVTNQRVVCTEGPFVHATGKLEYTDINIDCGKRPTALWLLAAGAGAAAAIAVATRSASQ
ncbi:MAG TPA: hypothetical protein VFO19_22260 [Vicinamibacterales bacterium]|nr:hypothetical protein [Vicinamibacterales bacterium]